MVVKIIRYTKPVAQTLVFYASGRIITYSGNRKLPRSARLFMDYHTKHIDDFSGAEIWE